MTQASVTAIGEKMKKQNLKSIFKNENGQGVLEYLILSGLIGIFCLVAVKQFGMVIKERIDDMKQKVTAHIKNIN